MNSEIDVEISISIVRLPIGNPCVPISFGDLPVGLLQAYILRDCSGRYWVENGSAYLPLSPHRLEQEASRLSLSSKALHDVLGMFFVLEGRVVAYSDATLVDSEGPRIPMTMALAGKFVALGYHPASDTSVMVLAAHS